MDRQLDLDEIESENRSLTLAPKYIQMGQEMFLHKN